MGETSQQGRGRLEALEDVIARLLTLQRMTEEISEHSMSITGMALRGEKAIDNGNLRLAAEIFSDVQRAGKRQREMLADMQLGAHAAQQMVAAVRNGKYGG